MDMMLDKKQIRAIFLFKFKMCGKAAETVCNIKNTFGPGTAKEGTVQRWVKKFCKGRWESWKRGAEWPATGVDNDQLRGPKLILLKLHKKLPKNSTSNILQSFGIWS